MCFDVFSKLGSLDDLGSLVDPLTTTPTVAFEGRSIRGYIQETFRFTEIGWTYYAWICEGYVPDDYESNLWEQEEHPSSTDEILAKIKAGELPLPKRSNREGLDFLNRLVNGIPEDELKGRIRQIRDALNKCRDLERIEAAARVFGV
ncbi:MAG: hypothetical protein Q8P01_03685 [bacterium]|nr:hypothetical protein [bacterium]